ncbi:MAG: S41 family peptidase [Dysgonamonadaceae bacterium]|jgi:hypothetical protein|nr:S41 family peptidase [Dysgonamonadaceae bacterium]
MSFNRIYTALLILCLILHSSCIKIEEFPDSPQGNFEALWRIIDEHYCFFDYKNVDWDKIHREYAKLTGAVKTDEELFNLLNLMLQELKDGHVNLTSPFNVGRYWKWYEDFPENFDQDLINNYLQTDYAIAGGLQYKILDDNTGYIRYGNFSSAISEQGLNYILSIMEKCKGIIIDVRNNGGGYLSNVEILASRFVEEKTLVGYIKHKTGKNHDDFSKPYPRYTEPSKHLHYYKPVVILTNRRCFSATNDFVNAMRYAPNVTIIGDQTGGGSGLPFSSEIPNGWMVRFSASPLFDAEMNHLEFGISPDIHAELEAGDIQKGKDTIIELARKLLN